MTEVTEKSKTISQIIAITKRKNPKDFDVLYEQTPEYLEKYLKVCKLWKKSAV